MSIKRDFKHLNDASRSEGPGAEGADEGRQPLILGLDTATDSRSVVVTRGTTILSHLSCDARATNSTSVLGDIDRVLGEASIPLRHIDLFAVAAGPGSFTGLRAGIATVKGLAMTLGKRAVGVQTLHAVGHGAKPSESLLALIPAGRGEVFAQHLSLREDGAVVEHGPPTHAAPEQLIEDAFKIGGRLKWAGSGAEKYLDLIREAARREGIPLTPGGPLAGEDGGRAWEVAARCAPLARSIAFLALGALRGGANTAAEELKAIYVRPADAKLKGE